ncbi:MAG TPA: ABC transporter substrate-binding protein [Candidatus Limnocylindrales bacterium]|nr:ABC transporter substrate-binding protein [Candidatus Limnocylindrales bacterium]
MFKRAVTKILFAAILILAHSRGGEAADAKTTRIAYPSAAASFIPLWAATDAGFFRKENLSVELLAIRSSPLAMTALLSGEIDVVVGGANPGISMQLQGYQDIALFGGLFNTFLFSICSVPSIEDLAQLKGKRLGVTRFGGSNDFAGRYFLRQRGIDPNRDLTLIQVGSQDDLLRALLAKNLDAAVMGYPAVLIAKKNGLHELADLTRSGLRYQLTAFVAKKSFVADRQTLARFIRALAASIHFLKTRPGEGTEITKRHLRISDPKILQAVYDLHVRLLPRLPEIQPEDLKLVLEEIALSNPKAKGADPAAFIDDRVLREVARSGFADRLYR